MVTYGKETQSFIKYCVSLSLLKVLLHILFVGFIVFIPVYGGILLPGHPEIITHLDSLTGANLVLPL